MKKLLAVNLALIISVFSGCTRQLNVKERQLQEFIDSHVQTVEPICREMALAYWRAATTGAAEEYQKVSEWELKLRQVYSHPAEFALLKEMKGSAAIKEPLLARHLEVLHNAYLENQMEPDLMKQIVELGNDIDRKFSTFRGTIDGEKVTDNQIKEILKTETNLEKRHKAWRAGKQVGVEVADDLIRLVRLRNQAAQKLGYENFHTLSLTMAEQDVDELDKIFNELYELTKEPYRQLKAELDGILAQNFGIEISEMMPWHYHDPFFQQTPLVYELDLDSYYEDKDVKVLAVDFYKGIGLPIESILAHSDLYERDGKNPHAFCTDIDRQGDVRILCNLKNNETWMETILHESGHGIYDLYQDPQTPYLLRQPAHIFSTEAIAMLMGRLSRNPNWMQPMLNLDDAARDEIARVSDKYAQLKQLIFARWAMVMFDFEKNLYANPDQDLNDLWWQTVAKYQLIQKPPGRDEPDWAAKIHFAIAPCYYHNYLLGELLASQLHHHIVHEVLKLDSDQGVGYVDKKEIGAYLRTQVFEPGAQYPWNDMITRATGEPLTAKYFVAQFVR